MSEFTPKKLTWLEKALETYRYHISQKKEIAGWRVSDTAKELNRSVGSVSQDLLIANWCRSHRIELEKFDYMKDALEWIKKKEDEIESMEFD